MIYPRSFCTEPFPLNFLLGPCSLSDTTSIVTIVQVLFSFLPSVRKSCDRRHRDPSDQRKKRVANNLEYFVCDYEINGPCFLSIFCSNDNLHGFCFSWPRWLEQRESPQPLGERQTGQEIFTAEKPYWDHQDHCSYQHVEPVSAPDSCTIFDKLSLPPGLGYLMGETWLPYGNVIFLCDFFQLDCSMTVEREVFYFVVDFHLFSQHIKSPFIYLSYLRRYSLCTQETAEG